MLVFLDEYGKLLGLHVDDSRCSHVGRVASGLASPRYSLVDSWLAILALCAFDIKWFGQERDPTTVSTNGRSSSFSSSFSSSSSSSSSSSNSNQIIS